MDVHSVNIPNFYQNQNQKDWFVYTCRLNPGYHKLLIYDPLMEQAFVKDFVVNLNKKDVYPEYPLREANIKKSEKAPNVWRTWYTDSQEGKFKSF